MVQIRLQQMAAIMDNTEMTHLWHVPFFFTVFVENPAPEGASATVQVLNVLPSVNVRADALTTMINRNSLFLTEHSHQRLLVTILQQACLVFNL